MIVKVWIFDNRSGLYANISPRKVFCLQLENEEGDPIDFTVVEFEKLDGEEFLDERQNPIPQEFAIPDRLLDCLDLVGAKFLDPDLVSLP